MDPAPELNSLDDVATVFPGLIGGEGPLKGAWVYTPIGGMIAVCSADALHMLEFPVIARLERQLRRFGTVSLGRTALTERLQDALTAYFADCKARFSLPLAPQGTAFEQRVWAALLALPVGSQDSYARIAAGIGAPRAVRAVGRANGANPISVVIPCHRVLGTDGRLHGYGGGLWRKEWLLAHEAQESARFLTRSPRSPLDATRQNP